MPFAVSQWPYSPDPRRPDFNIYGWNFGQVPPWAWTISTTEASGSMAIFNAGVLIKPTGLLPEDTLFENVHALPNGVTVLMSSKGLQAPVGPPPGITKSMGIQVREFGVDTWAGGLELLWPVAIQVQTPFWMFNFAPSGGTIPNPMKITPRIWSATTAVG